MPKRMTKEQFVEKARKIHGDKYDYSLVEYKNNKTKLEIICPIHGVFLQSPAHHFRGQVCPKCNKNSLEFFIKKSNKIHGDKYDYSLVEYENNYSKVKIICPEHGVFEQRVDSHYKGCGCPKCSNTYKKNTKEFINAAKLIHGNKYDYSITEYVNKRTKLKINCKIHGVFEQLPNNHLKGQNCYKCSESHGEKEISKLLEEMNIKFIREKRFIDCKNKNTLPFDFYLPEHNLCIEYNGKQHYESVEFFGGDKTLKLTQKNDKIKNLYCKENNIDLLNIKYDEDVETKLLEFL